ncbi:MAG: NADPH-dependent assimilatory sulfite reductase hemoprotein subunit [Candidatus Melainabacteria bacterium]|nr:NADPH-dependent assimilatory sulfite reductase hemoprotein subunit [Candidatus Melainabacteria bacterium]
MPDENPEHTKEEIIKGSSNYLRGDIKEELSKDTSHFKEETTKVLKFHGIYQQDNRDTRMQRVSQKIDKEYMFMIRTKLPGGQLTGEQYLGLNSICDKYSNQTLRITTRQTIQFHGVIKGDLNKTLNEINQSLVITYGSCGDTVRNVTACPVCDIDPDCSINLNKLAQEISNHFLPKSRAYYEIWIDGEKNTGIEQEPLYGKTYLPRKFKIGLALPHDNCVDVFIQDVGVVGICHDKSLWGFNILVGGGLGYTHKKPETFPRLGSELCFVTPERLIKTLEKIVTIHRDYGGRVNRKHARLKYLIEDKGINWFRTKLESRTGSKLEPFKKIQNYNVYDHLGWHNQKSDLWYLGLFIENGKICDSDKRKIKTGLKEIVEKFSPDIRLTPQQNIILANIKEEHKDEINKIIEKYKIYTVENVSNLRRNSMACPALPTCGLALAEAERALPSIIDELEKLGYGEEMLSLRMSGCPNSCSRTPMAELGIIGISTNRYNIHAGGNFEGTRLNKICKENILGKSVVSEIARLLETYREKRNPNERFGDFYQD